MSNAPVYVVLNVGSGHGDTETTCRAISHELAGRQHEILRVEDPQRLREIARDAVLKAQRSKGIVVAAGGDGTLSAVAQATLGSGCPFGVIPQGTFNYFGRAHGIPADAALATRALLSARVIPVQVGQMNEHLFLVNASLGMYPQSLEDREEQKALHGRSRFVAAWAALVTIFRGYRPRRMKLEHDGRTQELRTLTLFVGNNRLQLEQIGLHDAHCVDEGKLVAIVLQPVPALALLWLAAQGAMRELEGARGVQHFPFTCLVVTPSNPRVQYLKVAADGETLVMKPPIEFRISPEPLLLLQPIDATPESTLG